MTIWRKIRYQHTISCIGTLLRHSITRAIGSSAIESRVAGDNKRHFRNRPEMHLIPSSDVDRRIMYNLRQNQRWQSRVQNILMWFPFPLSMKFFSIPMMISLLFAGEQWRCDHYGDSFWQKCGELRSKRVKVFEKFYLYIFQSIVINN